MGSEGNCFKIINEVYFGSPNSGKIRDVDSTRDYLLDDLNNVFCGLIQHDILVKIIVRRKKLFSASKEELTSSGKILHDCIDDERSYLSLADLLKTFDKGLLVNLRKLVNDERRKDDKGKIFGVKVGSRTGGSFINDLLEFDKNGLLMDADKRMVVDGYHERLAVILEMAQTIKDKDYYNMLIKENEMIALHKDREPIKRLHRVEKDELIGEDIVMNIYSDKFAVKTRDVSDCIEDFAQLFNVYASLFVGNLFLKTPLNNYGSRLSRLVLGTYMAIEQSVPETLEGEVNFYAKRFPFCMKVLGWVK